MAATQGTGPTCLPTMLGSQRQGLGGPRMTKKGKADVGERERWLEAEVERLRLEAARLEEVNEVMRTEIFFKESRPTQTRSKMLASMKAHMEKVEATSPPVDAASRRIARQASQVTEDELLGPPDGPPQGRILPRRLTEDAEDIEDDVDAIERQQSKYSLRTTWTTRTSLIYETMSSHASGFRAKTGLLAASRPVQFSIYFVALGFAVFVLLATAFHLGEPHLDGGCGEGAASGSISGAASGCARSLHEVEDERLRRLGGGTSPLMKNLAFTLTMAGLVSLIMHILQQQLILAYLLAGVFVGPLCLNIVESPMAISELSSLGLVFLLFMIGLELDVKQALHMGREACITGLVQFPICALVMTPIFLGLQAAGLHFGDGPYSAMYCGITAALSSTMMVVKWLDHRGELDGMTGRFTVGILILQDLWAIVLLAVQTNLSEPTVRGFVQSFAMIAILVCVALAYAKFVMPAVLFYAGKSVELMLVMSLAWCFFICCAGILPFVGLPMEMAALIAGAALATFPYSAEFNSKIKYIRDFFFTIFFASMGMMLPVPRAMNFLCAIIIALVVLSVRPLGVFLPAWCMGTVPRVAAYSTLNLSQLSEFTLVICSLGVANGHVDEETLEIMIMVFAILAVVASYMLDYKHFVFKNISKQVLKLLGRPPAVTHEELESEDKDDGDDREILLLGLHKIAFLLIDEVQAKSPELLSKFHMIDVNTSIMPKLREMGVKCTYGDIGSKTVMRHARKGMAEPRIVLSTIPDSLLQGVTNLGMVENIKKVWPGAHIIALADDPHSARDIYAAGASYVVRMAKLSAERLLALLVKEHDRHDGDTIAKDTSFIIEVLKQFREEDSGGSRKMHFTKNRFVF